MRNRKVNKLLYLKILTMSLLILMSGCNGGSEGAFENNKLNGNVGTELLSIEVAHSDVEIAKGFTKQLTAIGSYSDGTVVNVSDKVDWRAAKEGVVSLSDSGILRAENVGDVIVVAALESVISNDVQVIVTDAHVTSLNIFSKDNGPMIVGGERKFKAMASLSDGTTKDVTNEPALNWDVDDHSILKEGEFPGVFVGNTVSFEPVTVTASGQANGKHFSDSKAVIVSDAIIKSGTLKVTVDEKSVAAGLSTKIQATATFTDGYSRDVSKDVTWESSDNSIVEVIPQESGQVFAFGHKVGEQVITASIGGDTASETIEVIAPRILRLRVEPLIEEVPVGVSKMLSVAVEYSHERDHFVILSEEEQNGLGLNWTSSNISIAEVSSSLQDGYGVVKGKQESQEPVEITATLPTPEGSTIKGSSLLTVVAKKIERLEITPNVSSRPRGLGQQFVARIVYEGDVDDDFLRTEDVYWTSDNSQLDLEDGYASTGEVIRFEGTDTKVKITAQYQSIQDEKFIATAELTVTEAEVTELIVEPVELTEGNVTVVTGMPKDFVAHAKMTDLTLVRNIDEVTWRSSNPNIAEVAEYQEGTITAKTGLDFSEKQLVDIIASHSTNDISKEGKLELEVIDRTPDRLEISAPEEFLPIGTSQNYVAHLYYDNGDVETDYESVSTKTSWSEVGSDGDKVTVNQNGLVEAKVVGSTTIKASGQYAGVSLEAQLDLTVTDAEIIKDTLVVVPKVYESSYTGTLSIPKGEAIQLVALADFSDQNDVDVSEQVNWVSSNIDIIEESIDQVPGMFETLNTREIGSVQVKAVYELDDGENMEGIQNVNVTPAELKSIQIKADGKFYVGEPKQLTAVGYYTDQSFQELDAEFEVSDDRIAEVDSSGMITFKQGKDQIILRTIELNGAFNGAMEVYARCRSFSAGACYDRVGFYDPTNYKSYVVISSPSKAYTDAISWAETSGSVYDEQAGFDGNYSLFTFEQAKAYCEGRGTYDGDNWRLPTENELNVIVANQLGINWPKAKGYWVQPVNEEGPYKVSPIWVYGGENSFTVVEPNEHNYVTCVK